MGLFFLLFFFLGRFDRNFFKFSILYLHSIIKPTYRGSSEQWSGEATRSSGFAVEETRVDVTIGDSDAVESTAQRKDRPVWMTESTVITNDAEENSVESILEKAALTSTQPPPVSGNTNVISSARNRKEADDIMSVLLQHEKQTSRSTTNDAIRGLGLNNDNSSDSSEEEKDIDNTEVPTVEIMDTDSDDDTPTVTVAGRPYPLDEINDTLIAEMTPQEKETYIQVYQDHFSHMYD